MKFMFFEVFKLAKNEIHVFFCLQKMKFMFFDVFELAIRFRDRGKGE